MFDGSTAGRAFESAAAPYVFGGLVVLSLAFWIWGHLQIRKHHRNRDTDDEEP